MGTDVTIPDPVYVRCLAAYRMIDLRATVGPYRTLIHAEQVNGVWPPVAVPPDLAEALLAGPDWEQVDAFAAVAEIAEADRTLDRMEREWRAQLDEQHARHRELVDLRQVIVAREQAESAAFKDARVAQKPDHVAAAAARYAGDKFAGDMQALADAEGRL
jgi:hypothetical protein